MKDWTTWFINLPNAKYQDIKNVARDAKEAEKAVDELSDMDEESFSPGDVKSMIADISQALTSDSEHIGDLSVKLDRAIEYADFLQDKLSNILSAYKGLGVEDDEDRTVEDISRWCEENMPDPTWYWVYLSEDKTKAVFMFDNDTDAVHFKMRWS